MDLSYVSVGIISLGEPEYETGRFLMLPDLALLLSPVEPLPVEFVAGGDGKPEVEIAPGLSGGSGRSGILACFGSLGGNDPMNIADKGRLEEAASERGGIRVGATEHQPRRARKKWVVVVVNSERDVRTTTSATLVDSEGGVAWELKAVLSGQHMEAFRFPTPNDCCKSTVQKQNRQGTVVRKLTSGRFGE